MAWFRPKSCSCVDLRRASPKGAKGWLTEAKFPMSRRILSQMKSPRTLGSALAAFGFGCAFSCVFTPVQAGNEIGKERRSPPVSPKTIARAPEPAGTKREADKDSDFF